MTQLLCTFLTQTLHTLYKNTLSKCKFSDFPLLALKFTKFLRLFFKQKVSFSSKFGSLFSVMEMILLYFLAETLYGIDKSGTSKCKFSDLPLLALKFTKFFVPFMEPRVSFSSNFASLFSIMRHNYSVYTFSSKSWYTLDKSNRSKCNFLDFWLLAWKLTKFIMSFLKPQVNFSLIFAPPFSVVTDNSYEIS